VILLLGRQAHYLVWGAIGTPALARDATCL
jgi:hypothetical protein